jgi:uncharacterized protein
MKLLITSDAHGDFTTMQKVIEKHQDIDYHLDAGDLCMDTKQFKSNLTSVKGNNDFFSQRPQHKVITIQNLKILLVHGHIENVKFGLERVKLKAKAYQVSLCIFGHTHQRFLQTDENIMFLNPGAIGDKGHSYAIYEDGKVTFMSVSDGE